MSGLESRSVIDLPSPHREVLRAGPLEMVFEPFSANLRYVRLGDREVLRGIYGAVRDRNWGTVEPRVTILEKRVESVSFEIVFDAECTRAEIDFAWRGSLTGSADGTVTFSMDGVVRSDFFRSRIGICVLHPARDCAGAAARVEHADGSVEEGSFPGSIAADQPFLDIRSVAHEVAPGVRAEVRFEGDVFEMEDQRNWTDASFKTYSTPLRIPFPVQVRKGDRVRQSVTLRIEGPAPVRSPRRAPADRIELRLGALGGNLPPIGLGLGEAYAADDDRGLRRLEALRPSHIAIDLHLNDPGWRDAWTRAWIAAGRTGCGIELRLFVDPSSWPELDLLRDETAFAAAPARLHRVLVFDEAAPCTREASARRVREALRAPGCPIGGGTNAYFAELNRGRPTGLDVVAWSVNPQVHAFDDASLVETFEGQAATVESARAIFGPVPLAVTPITLKPRFNPDATGAAAPADPGELPDDVDPRQATLFGAAWTLGSIASLSLAGASSLTYYETFGWRGVLEHKEGSPLPAKFPSVPGGVFPLYHVLADVLELAGGRVAPVSTPEPLAACGLAIHRHGLLRVLVANLTAAPRRVLLDTSGWRTQGEARTRILDAGWAMNDPERFRSSAESAVVSRDARFELELGTHAVARIDLRCA